MSIMVKQCRWCGYDICHDKQICIDPRSSTGDCEAEPLYHGFKFITDEQGEQHRFAEALRAAHLHVEEIDNYVVCEDDDIVKIEEVRKKHFGDFESRVRVVTAQLKESDLIRIEDLVRRRAWADKVNRVDDES